MNYTTEFKLQVIQYVIEHGKHAAGRHFIVDEASVRRWCSKRDCLRSK